MFNKLVKNSTLNLLGWIIPLIVNIVAIPFYIHHLTSEVYGIWILMGSVTGYFSLVQLGVGPALTKFVSEYNAKQDIDGLNKIINTSLVYVILAGSLVTLLVYILAPLFVSIFKITIDLEATILSLRIVGFSFVLSLLANAFSSIFDGYQRFDISNLFSIAKSVVTTVLSMILLGKGFGIVGMAVSVSLINLLAIGLAIPLLRHVNPRYKFTFQDIKKYSRIVFGFSTFAFISQMARLFTSRFPELVIGFVLGPAYVTYFSVPTRLVALFSSGTSSISAVLFPFASELIAKKEDDRLMRSYLRSSKYFGVMVAPVYFVFMFFSFSILNLWLGNDVAQNGWQVMTIASITYFVSSLTVVPSQYLMGYGKVKFIAGFSTGVALVSLFFLYPFTLVGGIIGASIAILLTQVFGILYIGKANQLLRVRIRSYLASLLPVYLMALLIGIPFALLNAYLSMIKGSMPEITVVIISFYLMTYLIISYITPGILDKDVKLALGHLATVTFEKIF